MGAVFISYRREQTAGEARALFNDLVTRIGKNLVFMDVDNITLGRDFRAVLRENLASCDQMLVLIGQGWLDAKDQSGRRRLDDPSDFIRVEIGAALKRNIPVTPVLLQGARMPAAQQLPEDLKELSFRNGFELSHTRWESDVQEMIKRLSLGQRPDVDAPGKLDTPFTERGETTPREKLTKKQVRGRWALVLAIAVVAAGLMYYFTHQPSKINTTDLSQGGAPARAEKPTEAAPKSSDSIEGVNDRIDRARPIVKGGTRGSRIGNQDLYFFKFAASSAKTRVILRKLNTPGFRGIIDVYDHNENRVAGETEGIALVGSQDQPVSFSLPSAPGGTYYVKVTITQPGAEYELTIREE